MTKRRRPKDDSSFQIGNVGVTVLIQACVSQGASSYCYPPGAATMGFQSNEQVVHDKVNLSRLVRRLEKTIAAEEWGTEDLSPRATWMKTHQTLQVCMYSYAVGVCV